MTYLAGRRVASLFWTEVAYVLELSPDLAEPLRTIALSLCLVADNNAVRR